VPRTDEDRFKLLFGPYRTPVFKYGDDAFCALHGDVILCGLTAARLPWPIGKKRQKGSRARSIVLYGALAEAVRRESAQRRIQMKLFFLTGPAIAGLCLVLTPVGGRQTPSLSRVAAGAPSRIGDYAELRVIDADTGRGLPLVELETVNRLHFVTDNTGRVAFHEPGLMRRQIFFTVRSHGYEVKKDGFGFSGVKVTPKPGQVSEIKLIRRNVAERLCRLTGEGRYRDTLLLGHKVPLADAPTPGQVAGQDSVQAVPYKGEVYWFWGDTTRMSYPLGLFRTAGARTSFKPANYDPADGIAFDYFVDKSGFARAMLPLPERPEGVIWIDGVCTVPDEKGAEKLVAHYSRRKGMVKELEHGLAVFNDEKKVFVAVKPLSLKEKWRFPAGRSVLHEEGGKKWLLFGNPAPTVRVRATWVDLLDPHRYEAFTCATAADKAK